MSIYSVNILSVCLSVMLQKALLLMDVFILVFIIFYRFLNINKTQPFCIRQESDFLGNILTGQWHTNYIYFFVILFLGWVKLGLVLGEPFGVRATTERMKYWIIKMKWNREWPGFNASLNNSTLFKKEILSNIIFSFYPFWFHLWYELFIIFHSFLEYYWFQERYAIIKSILIILYLIFCYKEFLSSLIIIF